MSRWNAQLDREAAFNRSKALYDGLANEIFLKYEIANRDNRGEAPLPSMLLFHIIYLAIEKCATLDF